MASLAFSGQAAADEPLGRQRTRETKEDCPTTAPLPQPAQSVKTRYAAVPAYNHRTFRHLVGQHPVVRSKEPEMSISLNLDDEQSARLEERARKLGVDARELAKAAVNDLLARPADDFDRAAKFVLEKNRELYRRLS